MPTTTDSEEKPLPTVGRIVHWSQPPFGCVPGIVAGIEDGLLHLHVFPALAMSMPVTLRLVEDAGKWHWPER